MIIKTDIAKTPGRQGEGFFIRDGLSFIKSGFASLRLCVGFFS